MKSVCWESSLLGGLLLVVVVVMKDWQVDLCMLASVLVKDRWEHVGQQMIQPMELRVAASSVRRRSL